MSGGKKASGTHATKSQHLNTAGDVTQRLIRIAAHPNEFQEAEDTSALQAQQLQSQHDPKQGVLNSPREPRRDSKWRDQNTRLVELEVTHYTIQHGSPMGRPQKHVCTLRKTRAPLDVSRIWGHAAWRVLETPRRLSQCLERGDATLACPPLTADYTCSRLLHG